MTAIDRRLIRAVDADRTVTGADRDPLQQARRAGRLQKLSRLGLAENRVGGRWQLANDLERALGALGERGDIIRTMQREFNARKLVPPLSGTWAAAIPPRRSLNELLSACRRELLSFARPIVCCQRGSDQGRVLVGRPASAP